MFSTDTNMMEKKNIINFSVMIILLCIKIQLFIKFNFINTQCATIAVFLASVCICAQLDLKISGYVNKKVPVVHLIWNCSWS